jgi:hypothetical protein
MVWKKPKEKTGTFMDGEQGYKEHPSTGDPSFKQFYKHLQVGIQTESSRWPTMLFSEYKQ